MLIFFLNYEFEIKRKPKHNKINKIFIILNFRGLPNYPPNKYSFFAAMAPLTTFCPRPCPMANSCQECRQQQPRRYGELGMVIYLFSPKNKQIRTDKYCI